MDHSPTLKTHEIALDRAPTADLRACLETWRGWRGADGAMPSWRSIDCLLELPSRVVASTAVVSVRREPRDYRYLFWGSKLTRIHGVDLTGRSYAELTSPLFAQLVGRQLDEIVERREPVIHASEFVTAVGIKGSEFVFRAPFSDDGLGVDRIVTCVWADDHNAGEWLYRHWRETA